jgi:hypothetical protein
MPALGADGAALLHARLLRRTLATAQAACFAATELWLAGQPDSDAAGKSADWIPRRYAGEPALRWRRQPGGDLGQRMHAALRDALRRSERAVLIGSDCPALTPALLARCARALDDHDVVLLPAQDGGYVLIGLRRSCWPLFAGMPWSQPALFAQTLRRARMRGLRCWVGPLLWDVDRPADLARLPADWLAGLTPCDWQRSLPPQ